MASMLKVPFTPLLYLSRRFRQDPDWTYRQALANTFIKLFLQVFVAFRTKPPLSLKPGLEGDRFVQIVPGPEELYTGITVDDEIHPETIGGTWFPTAYSYNTTTPSDKHIILHFHGGSYILGDGRTASCKFLANNLLAHSPSSHVFSLQYRLACNPKSRFPAQLQDAITAYCYLTHSLHIPASRIVLSGDSAGGHLVLALLRYIADYDDEKILPPPSCSWLFSPWCDIPGSRDTEVWNNLPNTAVDYLPASFPAWGAKHLIGNLELSRAVEPYLAPIWHPFALPSPVLVASGGREVMCPEHERLARRLQKLPQNEGRVEYFVQDIVPHDVLMVAWIMNFRKEAAQCAEHAGCFLTKFQVMSDESEVPALAFEA